MGKPANQRSGSRTESAELLLRARRTRIIGGTLSALQPSAEDGCGSKLKSQGKPQVLVRALVPFTKPLLPFGEEYFYSPLLVIKVIYHYWKYICFPGDLSKCRIATFSRIPWTSNLRT